MVAVPAVPPVTVPVLAIDAIVDELLLQMPPPVPSDKEMVRPGQTLIGEPEIAFGNGLTVTVVVVVQPVPIVYVTVAVPTPPPVINPLADPIITLPVPAVLFQMPPVEASDKPVVKPGHMVSAPFIVPGNAFMVTVAVAIQPVGNV